VWFLTNESHLGLIIREGHGGIVQEAQRGVFMLAQTQ
jgi:hypothetical protein